MKISKDIKIAVADSVYVGLYIAILQHHQVTAKNKLYVRDFFQRD